MKVQINQHIVWATSLDDPTSVRRGTVVKVSGEFVQYGPKAEDSIHSAFVFPARVADEFIEILAERQRLRKAYDDSMGLIYSLRNAITREEK